MDNPAAQAWGNAAVTHGERRRVDDYVYQLDAQHASYNPSRTPPPLYLPSYQQSPALAQNAAQSDAQVSSHHEPIRSPHQNHYMPQPEGIATEFAYRGSGESSKQLACANCRKKKIKCQPQPDGPCRACSRTGAECVVPAVDERKLSNSKKLVRGLYARIEALEAELLQHRVTAAAATVAADAKVGAPTSATVTTRARRASLASESIISIASITSHGSSASTRTSMTALTTTTSATSAVSTGDGGVGNGNGAHASSSPSCVSHGVLPPLSISLSSLTSPSSPSSPPLLLTPDPTQPSRQQETDSMIVRLCGGFRQLGRERLRDIGPHDVEPRGVRPRVVERRISAAASITSHTSLPSLPLLQSLTSPFGPWQLPPPRPLLPPLVPRQQHQQHRQQQKQQQESSVPTYQWQDIVSSELQEHLFELYWTYQHEAMPVLHRDAFLQDFRTGNTRYCSRLLVHCILARAASIAMHADIRAMALGPAAVATNSHDYGDDLDDAAKGSANTAGDDVPVLVSACAELLDAELAHPGVTTLQSLALLSAVYGVAAHDTKGWLHAGGAARLALELGLHISETAKFRPALDVEIRQIGFWACISLDRQWSLYLGRPEVIKLEDIAMLPSPCSSSSTSLELRLATASSSLLAIVGVLCEALNGARNTHHRITALDSALRDWYTHLDADCRYHPRQIPAVFQLHMQYSAAILMLYRPIAQFGDEYHRSDSCGSIDTVQPPHQKHCKPQQTAARQICVQQVDIVAQYLQQYAACHGSLRTLPWAALHVISTATTTLIAILVETAGGPAATRSGPSGSAPHGWQSAHLLPPHDYRIAALHTCLGALAEFGQSHLLARRVRRVVLRVLRLLRIEAAFTPSLVELGRSPPLAAAAATTTRHRSSSGPASIDMCVDDPWPSEVPAHMHAHAQVTGTMTSDEFIPSGSCGSQTEMLASLEALLGPVPC